MYPETVRLRKHPHTPQGEKMAYICLWSVGPSCCVPSGKLLSSEPHFSHFQNRGTHPHFSNGGFLSLPGGSPLSFGSCSTRWTKRPVGMWWPRVEAHPLGSGLALPRIHEASLCCSWGNREEKGLSFPNCGTTRGYTPASQTLNLETYFPR